MLYCTPALLAYQSGLIFYLTSALCHDPHFDFRTFSNIIVSDYLWLYTLTGFFRFTN
jgi:hypothetical protein